jgi:hypothetical protein
VVHALSAIAPASVPHAARSLALLQPLLVLAVGARSGAGAAGFLQAERVYERLTDVASRADRPDSVAVLAAAAATLPVRLGSYHRTLLAHVTVHSSYATQTRRA